MGGKWVQIMEIGSSIANTITTVQKDSMLIEIHIKKNAESSHNERLVYRGGVNITKDGCVPSIRAGYYKAGFACILIVRNGFRQPGIIEVYEQDNSNRQYHPPRKSFPCPTEGIVVSKDGISPTILATCDKGTMPKILVDVREFQDNKLEQR